jgi:hypothetical protein
VDNSTSVVGLSSNFKLVRTLRFLKWTLRQNACS